MPIRFGFSLKPFEVPTGLQRNARKTAGSGAHPELPANRAGLYMRAAERKRAALMDGPGYLAICSGKFEHGYFKVQFLACQRVIAIQNHGLIGEFDNLHFEGLAIFQADFKHAAQSKLLMVGNQLSVHFGNHLGDMGTITIFGSDHHMTALSRLETDNRLVESRNHLVGADRKLERLAPLGRVEYRAVCKAADIIHTDLITNGNHAFHLVTHQFAVFSTLINSTSNSRVVFGPIS